jgi:aminobenzoyl-glutamate utilization protein B
MRYSTARIARVGLIGISLTLPASLLAQGRGGGGGGAPDNRPEVTFAVTIPPDDAKLAAMKKEAIRMIDSMSTFTQQMVDMVFSFGEPWIPGSRNERVPHRHPREEWIQGDARRRRHPNAWTATWGSGKPVISLGSDIDDIPQASQKPGVGYKDPIVATAPGHGEGHNAGVPMNITAAIAVKKIMERDKIPGTIHLWPGVAEELMAGKMYFVRAGMFKDVDAVLFAHISNDMGVSYGQSNQAALISAQFHFQGSSSHAAGAPWAGRSALDAVELMDVAWNFRREHLPLQQRSHYVITDGGDQPNVVPPTATVWYYFREQDAPKVQALFALGDTLARAAAMMTSTKLAGVDIVGGGWSGHFNKVIAMQMNENIKAVGMPEYSEADQQLARGIQRELGQTPRGLGGGRGGRGGGGAEGAGRTGELPPPPLPSSFQGGGSDDIGDVSWNVPTVTLRFPGNIPGLPGTTGPTPSRWRRRSPTRARRPAQRFRRSRHSI